jgi:hypothetical protein
VVRDLEDVGADGPPFRRGLREQAQLAALLEVAREEYASATVRHAQRDRPVVGRAAGGVRPEHRDRRAADLERVARAHVGRRNARGRELLAKSFAVRVRSGVDESPAHVHPPKDCLEAADVIDVPVARDDVVEPADAERPERLAYHALADVETLGHERHAVLHGQRRVETRPAAGVDEHRLPVRESHERRVTLTHVEKHHMQQPVGGRSRDRCDDERGGRERGRGAEDGSRAPPGTRGRAGRRWRPPRGGPGKHGERRRRDPRQHGAPPERRRDRPPLRKRHGRAVRDRERRADDGNEGRAEPGGKCLERQEDETRDERDTERGLDHERRRRARRRCSVEEQRLRRRDGRLHDDGNP